MEDQKESNHIEHKEHKSRSNSFTVAATYASFFVFYVFFVVTPFPNAYIAVLIDHSSGKNCSSNAFARYDTPPVPPVPRL